jgi:hypothetical protein
MRQRLSLILALGIGLLTVALAALFAWLQAVAF